MAKLILDDPRYMLAAQIFRAGLDPKDRLPDKEISDDFLDIRIGWK
jgi:hypothetical protein